MLTNSGRWSYFMMALLLFAALLVLPQAVLAAPVPDTGQTLCYDAGGNVITCPSPGQAFYGQDAQYNHHPRSYTKLNASGNALSDSATSWVMVRDNVTGLIWENKTDDDTIHDKDKTFTWCDTNSGNSGTCGAGTGDAATDTEAFINALNAANYGGHNDWRMPTVKELSTLVNSAIPSPGPAIDAAWFPNTVSSSYWSSTLSVGGAGYSWLVDFHYGRINKYGDRSNSYYVRAVRGRQQSSSLTDNGDDTVADSVTGLMWQQVTAPGTYTWEQALAYVSSLNSSNYLGYSDWRLPDRNELQSLVDYSRYDPAIAPLLAANTVSSNYWSSTTDAYATNNAWLVHFSSGLILGIGDHYKSNSYYVRAVRAGQSGALGSLVISKTGQNTCYDTAGTVITCTSTGQDGELKAGVAWPNLRFTDNGDQTVTDKLTGLIWAQDANLMATRDPGFDADGSLPDGYVTWQHALDYIKKLNAENYLGHNDWRLPNVNEVRSLVNSGQSDCATWLNYQKFRNVKSGYYWSSSSIVSSIDGSSSTAWIFNTYNGDVGGYDKASRSYVWPVRGGQSGASGSSVISLPKTGQTTCYDAYGYVITCAGTGQDGELQIGMAWPDSRFSDNGDATVTDNLTGLIWTKDGKSPGPSACSPGGVRDWQGALDYVKCLNTNNYLGQNDWHLPNRNELRSLVNFGQSDCATWLNYQKFSNVSNGSYWSATTNSNDPEKAWDVEMYNGSEDYSDKGFGEYVWPVRGGQFGSLVISKAGTGTGAVTANTGTINWSGNTGTASYTSGTPVTLTATANSGSTFTGWSGACTNVTGTCALTMDAAKNVTATFAFNPAFASATTTAAGDKVTISFSKVMANPAGKHGQFTVLVNGSAAVVSAAALNADSTKIDLTLATSVAAGQTVTVSYAAGDVKSADGGVLAGFAAQTVTNSVVACDTTPAAFAFTEQTNVALNASVVSNAITVSGITCATPISITGGTYSVNGGAYSSANGTVVNGDTVTVKLTSSVNYSIITNAVLTIGGVSNTFSVTTLADVAPTITSATSSTVNGTYLSGANINITLNFSEAVSSTGTGLTITLNTGALLTTGALSNVTSWSGTYTVAAGQTTADLTITSVTGTITDATSNSTANPVIPAGQNIGDGKAIVISVNGACGSANGGTFASVPDTGLCDYGTASTPAGTGPWAWSCEGLNGGSTASCSAQAPLAGRVQKIVYATQEASGYYDLWMMDPDGLNKQRLTDEAKDGISSTNPSIFPDGGKILYLRGGVNIAVLDIKTSGVTMLTTDGVDGSYAYSYPRLSADGTKITYEYGQHIGGSCSACQTFDIYMMNADGTNKVRMTENSYRDTTPIFSPDGAKVMITHYQGAPSSDCCNATNVYTMDIATKTETLLYASSGYDWGFDWKDSGIIFTMQTGEVMRINPDGTGVSTLLDSSKKANSAVFSPSGSRILYVSNIGGSYDLYTADADGAGSNPVPLTTGINVSGFTWGYIGSANTKALYASFTNAGIWQWGGSGWTQLTTDNPESMVAAGSNLYGKFANGIWQWTGSGWNKLTPDKPAEMAASGENLYGNFAGAGIWQWNGTGWNQLTPDNPERMTAAGSNLYGKFESGIWQWNGSGWKKLTPDKPAEMVAAGSNLYGSFTGSGIWQWNGSGWSLLTPDIPERMSAAGSNLYGKFESGIWQWNGSGWSLLTPDKPAEMVAAGSNLYGSFTGNGIWQWNGSGWSQLTPDNPAIMAVGE